MLVPMDQQQKSTISFKKQNVYFYFLTSAAVRSFHLSEVEIANHLTWKEFESGLDLVSGWHQKLHMLAEIHYNRCKHNETETLRNAYNLNISWAHIKLNLLRNNNCNFNIVKFPVKSVAWRQMIGAVNFIQECFVEDLLILPNGSWFIWALNLYHLYPLSYNALRIFNENASNYPYCN